MVNLTFFSFPFASVSCYGYLHYPMATLRNSVLPLTSILFFCRRVILAVASKVLEVTCSVNGVKARDQ